MKPTIKYRPEDNAATIRLSDAAILESAEVSSDVATIALPDRDYSCAGRHCR